MITPIEWDISAAMKRAARAASDTTHKNLKRTPNYTDLESQDRFYHGFLGEFIIEGWLKAENVVHRYVIDVSGRSKGADFEVELPDHSRFRLECKAASHVSHRNLMVPVRQWQAHNHQWDALIGVRLDLPNDKGAIMGSCSKAEFAAASKVGEFGRDVPTKFRPFIDLFEPQCILRLARTGDPHGT